MRLLYNISIHFYLFTMHVVALFKPKARLWINGRKNLFSELKVFAKNNQPTAWFHCASLGEFEQGRPLIEAFRDKHPDYRILLTFYSPSGFEVRKKYEFADYVCYLPADTRANAKRFVKLVEPDLVVFVKYEYWHNIMHEVIKRNIPLFALSANFRPGQYFFSWYGRRFLKNLKQITHFFVQNQNSAGLLISNGITQVTVTGDTRFDRVKKIAEESVSLPLIEKFIKGRKDIIVAGSTWQADEILLVKLFNDNPGKYKLIIAPHEITETHLQSIESLFQGATARYSQARQDEVAGKQVLIIDGIGLLSKLYRYGRYAYIGGGFGVGIHNVPEAAVYGIPVIFGPNYRKFQEAVDMIGLGSAFSVNDYKELSKVFRHLSSDQKAWQHCADTSREYVIKQLGATAKVLSMLEMR